MMQRQTRRHLARAVNVCLEEASAQILIMYWASNHTCGPAAEFAPYWIKAVPAAPLAQRQRRAQPWEARPAHAGHIPQDSQIKAAHMSRRLAQRTAVVLAL